MKTDRAKQVIAKGTTALCRGITRGGAGVEYPGRPKFAVQRKTAYRDSAMLPSTAALSARNPVATFSDGVGAAQMAKTTRDTPEPKRGLKHALKPHVRHRPIRLLRLTGWLKGAKWAGKGVAGAEGEPNEPVDAEVVRRAMVKKN